MSDTTRLRVRKRGNPAGSSLGDESNSDFMDPFFYLSDDVFEFDMRKVLPSSWVFVGEISSLQKPGDFITDFIGHEPVVVIVDTEGRIRAFSNVCTHRASLLVEDSGNCGRLIKCPYHAWSFGLDGSLLGVPYQNGFTDNVDKSQLGLIEFRLDIWTRFIFVNISGDAPPLLEYLSPLPEQLAQHDLISPKMSLELNDIVDVHWKIMVDNAFCDYHLPFVHGNSIGRFADPDGVTEKIWKYTGRITAKWKDEELSSSKIVDGLTGDGAKGSMAYSVFPNWFIAVFPNGGFNVMWWSPLSAEKTRARVHNFSIDAHSDLRSGVEQLKAVQKEDYEICRRVQEGIRSGHYRPGPQHALELRISSFRKEYLRIVKESFNSSEI